MIVLSEVKTERQTEYITHMQNLKTITMDLLTKSRFTDFKNKLTVTKRERGGDTFGVWD